MNVLQVNYNGKNVKYVLKGDVNYICIKDVCDILGLLNSNNVSKRIHDEYKQLFDVKYELAHDNLGNPVYRDIPTVFVAEKGIELFLNTSRKQELASNLLNWFKGINLIHSEEDMYAPITQDDDIIGLQNISNVRCYKDDNGEVFLNLEDIAYGLGFTQNALSGNITVRWYLVKKYLEDIENEMITLYGVPKVWYDKYPSNDRLPSYISENVFYRLAVKSNNQNAILFRAKVFDEILPMIRRTGMYIYGRASIQ